jgi:hypothetical protein
MFMEKYGAVIGWKNPITWNFRLGIYKNASFQPITAPYFPMIIKSRNFARRQYE